MAIFKGNDISGMVGPVVFLKLNGRGVIRRAPRERKKNDWSQDQMLHRSKISSVGAFWRSVPDQIKLIFGLAAKKMTAYNLFLKTNLGAFSPDGSRIDPEWLHLSAGKLPLPNQLTAARLAGDPQKIEVSWQNDFINRLSSPKDNLMMIAAYEGKFTSPVTTNVTRSQESAVVDLPAGVDNIEGIYLFFGSEQRELYSEDKWFKI